MKNLKEYRDKELKWFLFANILLMIISSGLLVFGETIDSWIKGVSSVLNVTVFSSAIYILTFVFDSVVPSRVKVFLVFLWRKQPSATIFTDLERKFSNDGYRYDHCFVAKELAPHLVECSYVHETRKIPITDHSAMTMMLEL